LIQLERLGRFRGYSLPQFRKDLLAGFIVGIVAIPLGMSFAIASGVKPVYGIYTTIIAGILISLFGGSRFQIGGPTGAFVPILLGIVLTEGYDNLLVCGLMAGVLLLLMGFLRLGTLIRYIPRPVTIGFTAGIAVLIFSGQITSFFGLRNIQKHETFLLNMKEIVIHISTVNLYSVLTAIISLAAIILVPKISRKLPGAIFGLMISALVAEWFYPGQVATIGSTFGAIPGGLPGLHIPTVTWGQMLHLLPSALVVAMLGGIESLLSVVVADQMSGTRHDSNRELIGQGIANIVTPLFGGIPATGAIARTATNIRNGAATPVSGIIHGGVVLLILLVFANYASDIPLASMAPILMVVAWNMSERKEFVHLLRTKSGDAIVMAVTFLLTVLTSLPTAVGVGLVVAAILFIKRMSEAVGMTRVIPDPLSKNRKVRPSLKLAERECPQLQIFTLEGPLFFGAAHLLEQTIASQLKANVNVLIFRMGKVLYLDTTGESQLLRMIRRLRNQGIEVLISGLQAQPQELLARTGLLAEIGDANLFAHTGETLQYAISEGIDHERCARCSQNAFHECACLSKGVLGQAADQREVTNELRTAKV
jgi:SulP family sulfate permease